MTQLEDSRSPGGGRRTHQGLRRGVGAVGDKYSGSSMENLWNRLNAIGVVIILGAVTGLVWREQGLAWSNALRRLSRRSQRAER